MGFFGMNKSEQNATDLATAISQMARQQREGSADRLLEIEHFSGHNATIARAVNELAKSHTDYQKKIADIAASYAIGNFNGELEKPIRASRYRSR